MDTRPTFARTATCHLIPVVVASLCLGFLLRSDPAGAVEGRAAATGSAGKGRAVQRLPSRPVAARPSRPVRAAVPAAARPVPAAARPVPAAEPAASEARAACPARLALLGAEGRPLPAIAEGACGVADPVRLSGLAGGLVVAPAATLGCPVAEAFARWMAEVVAPEARLQLGRVPATVLIGDSYQCRGRNRVVGATLSEHAFGNAVDVIGFGFEGRGRVLVKDLDPAGQEGRFVAAIRARACQSFATVLGPGSDPEHADHLHLDLRERKGGRRLCQ